MKRVLIPLFIAVCCPGQTGVKSGIDRANLDTTCKPCDDFWRFANGAWLDKNPIPARYARWGPFPILYEANQERMRTILEASSANPNATGNELLVGNFYKSCMNTAAIDKAGITPLEPELQRISAIASTRDLIAELVRLEPAGITPMRFINQPDRTSARNMIAALEASPLSLPDRDYYFRNDEKTEAIRQEFTAHVSRMLVLAGDRQDAAPREAAEILAFETELAEPRLTRADSRNPEQTFHKQDLAALRQLAPSYDWDAALAADQIAPSIAINVQEPAYVKAVNERLAATPLETWKLWLRWRLVSARAQYLSSPFYNEWFHFNQTVLSGVKEPQPRWQICARATDSMLGYALGRLFVEKYFPPEAKRRMSALVENLRAALREELQNAAWLAPATRESAIAKLDAFEPLIGYPEHWRDYSAVSVKPESYEANVESAILENRRFDLSQIGKPVDRTLMGRMTPPTVNAGYDPARNAIAFPAGILQPPFFTMDADDAVNYGAIGMAIGHEMGHGFDDQGSKFDADGNLKNWWTDEDRKKFEARAACVTSQFDSIDVGNGLHHNGKLVTGEAMGDLGGLTLAYKAYHRALNGKEAPVIDGFTGDQRFFLAFAHIWAEQQRPEEQRLALTLDFHPLAKYRANATLQNMPEFRHAFNCKQGDPMVRPEAERCQLW